MSEALQKAKRLFDEELDKATSEVIKRWQAIHKKSSNSKVAELLTKLSKRGRPN